MESDPLAGTPYRTLRPLASGGMGEILEAEHTGLRRRVAVKLLHRHLLARRDVMDRMRLEAEALGCIRHPNVVNALDCGFVEGRRPFIVMERLNGRTLRDELAERGRLPAVEAIGFAVQALDGLAAVHHAGMVHRDIKLDNLFVCDAAQGERRVVKLLDLGVAKVQRVGGAAPAPLNVMTEEGVSMGTPRFFSPEQAMGGPLDARADVYAMGVVLYALVTGRAPFDHLHGVPEVLKAHALEPPEPPSRRAPIPPPLEAAILKALSKRPEHRFPSAASFAAELRRIAGVNQAPGTLKIFVTVLVASFVLSATATAAVHGVRRTAPAGATAPTR